MTLAADPLITCIVFFHFTCRWLSLCVVVDVYLWNCVEFLWDCLKTFPENGSDLSQCSKLLFAFLPSRYAVDLPWLLLRDHWLSLLVCRKKELVLWPAAPHSNLIKRVINAYLSNFTMQIRKYCGEVLQPWVFGWKLRKGTVCLTNTYKDETYSSPDWSRRLPVHSGFESWESEAGLVSHLPGVFTWAQMFAGRLMNCATTWGLKAWIIPHSSI